MERRSSQARWLPGVALVAGIFATLSGARAASSEKVLYTFTGGADGGGPQARLVFDAAGNLYGTTHFGGIVTCGGQVGGGCGVVFQLKHTPSGGWKEHALYAFADGSDGGFPNAGVIVGSGGNLYGTASTGGSTSCSIGCGVVYSLVKSRSGWTENVLHTFTGGDGQFPNAVLIADSTGALYSTTWYGGASGAGTVFRLIRAPAGGWTESVLHSFNGTTEGSGPAAGVIRDAAGDLFGTTYPYNHYTDGVVYELVPQRNGTWIDNVLETFGSGSNGCNPYAGLIADTAGNLYGTTIECGTYGVGVAFKMQHGHGAWTEKVLHTFGSGTDGGQPYAGLVADGSGNLYGTTVFGGTNKYGAVYELVRTHRGYKERVLYDFTGGADGGNPAAALTLDGPGNLYGTTEGGGAGYGVVFELTP